ncbi:MAG: GerW family sporulation protein [Clostridia bacterium]|nr:GerW family sporulation protein [Clostridia bacterium]
MNEHPIEGLMTTAMDNIKDMIDVNTIIGEPIETSNNVVIIPISKVCFGFAAGGSEFKGETIGEYSKKDKEEEIQYNLPFGGGAGAGVNINPVAFLVIQGSGVKLLPVEHSSSIDRLLDYMPDLMEKANNLMNKMMQDKKEEKNKVRQEEIRQKKEEEKKEQKQEKMIQKTRPKRNPVNPNIAYEYEYDEQPYDEQEVPHVEYEEFDKYEDE